MADLKQFIPSFGGIGNINASGVMGSFIKIFIIVSIVGILAIALKFILSLKFKYVYRAEVYRRRQDYDGIPTSMVNYGIAGYFKKRSGKTVFRIRYGIRPSQVIEMSKLPDPNYMIGNKVTYLQLNKDNLVQAKVGIDWEGTLKIEPVEDDLKFSVQLDLEEKQRVLEAKKLTPVTISMIVIGFILVAGIIVYYFLSKA